MQHTRRDDFTENEYKPGDLELWSTAKHRRPRLSGCHCPAKVLSPLKTWEAMVFPAQRWHSFVDCKAVFVMRNGAVFRKLAQGSPKVSVYRPRLVEIVVRAQLRIRRHTENSIDCCIDRAATWMSRMIRWMNVRRTYRCGGWNRTESWEWPPPLGHSGGPAHTVSSSRTSKHLISLVIGTLIMA